MALGLGSLCVHVAATSGDEDSGTEGGTGSGTPASDLSGLAQLAENIINAAEQAVEAAEDDSAAANITQEAKNALGEIDKGKWPPQGIKGGGTFANDGRGGGEVLSKADSQGNPITYREWDVNPAGPSGRDAIRIVTGSDGSAWYTDNHYVTFTRIR